MNRAIGARVRSVAVLPWPASRAEAGFAAFVAVQTFVALAEEDRWSVLLWWQPDAWPYTALLWLKDLALAAAAACAAILLLRGADAAERRGDGGTRLDPSTVLAALAALAAGVACRLAVPDRIPPGVFSDTVLYALPLLREPSGGWLAGARLVETPGSGGFAVSPLLLGFPRLLFGFVGAGEAGFQALNAVCGLGLVAAVTILAREVSGPRTAVVAAALAALGGWPLILSRWAWAELLTVSCLTFAAAVGLAALRRRSTVLGAIAGTAAGLAAHGHSSGLVVGAVLAGAAAILAFRRRGLRRTVAAALLPAGLLVVGWAALHRARTGEVGGRYAQVGVWTASRRAELADVPGPFRIPAAVAFNLRVYSGLLVWTGDPNPRMGIPREPVLSPLLGIAALVGLALHLRGAARGDLPGAAISLLALGALASGVFANPDGAPNSLRASGLLPVALLCAARALRAGDALLGDAGVRRGVRIGLLGAVLLCCETVPALTTWPERPDVRAAFFAAETEAARVRRASGSGETVLDPAAIRQPETFEMVALGTSLHVPLRRLPARSPASCAADPPAERYWYVTTRDGARTLRSAGNRVSRPASGAGGPSVVLVVRSDGPAATVGRGEVSLP